MGAALQWWAEFSKRPFVAHILRMIERFNVRGGGQLAAAIAFFSVLSLVPILMLAFSGLGLALTVFRPDALGVIETWINGQLDADSDLGKAIYAVVARSLTSWASTGLVSLGIIMWVGSNWVGNLKRAVRLLMRTEVDRPGKPLPLPLEVLANFAGLVGVLVGVAATFAASAIASGLGGALGDLLGLAQSPGWSVALRLLSAMVSLLAGAALFRLLFGWFSPHPIPSHLAWVGAGIGSAGLLVLQALTGIMISAFSNNLGFAVFGSTIVLMLFLNLFATLILMIAAWLATADEPLPEPELEAEPVPPEPLAPVEPGQEVVSAAVARRSMGIGLGTGYVVGSATGLGLGALLVGALSKLRRK
ncbi:MAG TPA: YhjD/YihY/BrkB family envelope integrity protein [Propionicimonas sp.]|nr:YhjD/YihY/BrkB family envelope integrity protein [Propionicimonas sp.]HRA07158.1 YhjD/YihY/BrkB family envelope integrity protein [Propionicimonas sp.]